MPRFARVLVDDSAGKSFVYELPGAVAAVLQPGSRVRVPVRTRTALATVIELLEETGVPGVRQITDVVSAEPILSPVLLRLGAWIADYYCCSIEAAMKSVLPQVIRKAEVGHKTQLFARLVREVSAEEIEALEKKAPLEADAVRFLTGTGAPLAVAELMEKCDASHQAITAVVKKGVLAVESAKVERDPHQSETFVAAGPLALNVEQVAVFERVRAAVEHSHCSHEPGSDETNGRTATNEIPKPVLLHGVTGSGKTEIYLQAIHLVLERGQSAIMLVPEISLTPQTVERFKSRFAATQHEVAVLHSHFSEGERLDEPLITAINARLAKREQTILFLNRRGFSTSPICPAFGHVCECPNCSVALTFHRAAGRIVCHICGYQAVAPGKCPACAAPGIKYSGTGTEKVEDAVAKLFPTAVVMRMDADSMQRRDAYRETLGAFRTGKIDILVGTQMIAKGLHFPNVTLVGIVNADLGLHMPDFRAGERTVQLLTHVAGRAGRGDVEGEVFVQSFTPFHPAIQFARHHDFDGFWEAEIQHRRDYDQPPFTHLVLIVIRSAHQQRASFSAETLHRRLSEAPPPGVTLSEPAPAPLEKSHGSFRLDRKSTRLNSSHTVISY